jgi:hypothetical protein
VTWFTRRREGNKGAKRIHPENVKRIAREDLRLRDLLFFASSRETNGQACPGVEAAAQTS